MTNLERILCAALKRHLDGKSGRPPAGAEIIWNAFARLSSRRGMGFSGPNPITFTEIEAFARLERLPLEPHHVRVIEAMDRTWLDHAAGPKPKPGISAAAFDGMLA